MPYSVEHLVGKRKKVIVVHQADRTKTAIDLMMEHDFSQLPVLNEEGRIQGMVTCESILRAEYSSSRKAKGLLVRDALIHAPCHYLEDDLFDILDELRNTSAVLLIDPSGALVGIVTSYDAVEYLRKRTEDFVRIEEIEFTIKELIKKGYHDLHGSAAHQKLISANGERNADGGEQHAPKKHKALEELNLGDYINLLVAKDTWGYFGPILGINKDALLELLDKVRLTRNDLAHFRGEISPQSREELRYCANLLRGRYQDFERERERPFIDSMSGNHIETLKVPRKVREESRGYRSGTPKGGLAQAEKSIPRGRYGRLTDWLTQQVENKILLTFDQVEEIIQSPLPASALQLRVWWANETTDPDQFLPWLEAGWEVTYVDLDEKRVIFARLDAMDR
jgi:CBS domain-containing protein